MPEVARATGLSYKAALSHASLHLTVPLDFDFKFVLRYIEPDTAGLHIHFKLRREAFAAIDRPANMRVGMPLVNGPSHACDCPLLRIGVTMRDENAGRGERKQ